MFSGQSRRRGDRGISPYFVILAFRLLQMISEQPYKPPVTLALIAVNSLLFFRHELPLPGGLQHLVPDISDGCIMPARIVFRGEWSRLLWSAFLHLDDMHLYYNMASLLVKGVQLEQRLGSLRFAGLVAELVVLAHGLMALACCWLGETYPDLRYLSRGTCAAGFSAVLFALKYVLTHNQPGFSQPMGLPLSLPTKYLAWAELLLVHYLVPQSSFSGHLAGVAAGWLHVHVVSQAVAPSSPPRRLLARCLRWLRSGQRQQQLQGARGPLYAVNRPGPVQRESGAVRSAPAADRAGGGAEPRPGPGPSQAIDGSRPQALRTQGAGQWQQVGQGSGQGQMQGQSVLSEEEVRQARLARFDRPQPGARGAGRRPT
ncbi:hypothetical protein QJQ45_029214 [Haematococcus lacustris]|nr:hypothetical protein QJQ45_029214 [Haematococcus lacustris]